MEWKRLGWRIWDIIALVDGSTAGVRLKSPVDIGHANDIDGHKKIYTFKV